MPTSPLPPVAAPVTAHVVLPLRTRVLRPDWPAGRLLTFAEDGLAATVHVAAGPAGAVVGVATVYPQSPPAGVFADVPDVPAGAAWQLRGMATDRSARGTGVGAAVLAACVAAVAGRGGALLWCNARTSAAGFYERAGWTPAGGVFDVPGVGPHVRMARAVTPGPPDARAS